MKSTNPGMHLIFFLIEFPVECQQNHVWKPIFDPIYDHIYKCDYFGYIYIYIYHTPGCCTDQDVQDVTSWFADLHPKIAG